MFDKLGTSGLLGLVVLVAGIALVAWENLVVAAGLALILVGLVLVAKGLVSNVMQAFGFA